MTADIEMFKASEETLSGGAGKLFVRSWRASAKSSAILAIRHGSSTLRRSGRRYLVQAEADREPDFQVEILDTKVVEAMNGHPGASLDCSSDSAGEAARTSHRRPVAAPSTPM